LILQQKRLISAHKKATALCSSGYPRPSGADYFLEKPG
jgi:hypothetical protein